MFCVPPPCGRTPDDGNKGCATSHNPSGTIHDHRPRSMITTTTSHHVGHGLNRNPHPGNPGPGGPNHGHGPTRPPPDPTVKRHASRLALGQAEGAVPDEHRGRWNGSTTEPAEKSGDQADRCQFGEHARQTHPRPSRHHQGDAATTSTDTQPRGQEDARQVVRQLRRRNPHREWSRRRRSRSLASAASRGNADDHRTSLGDTR